MGERTAIGRTECRLILGSPGVRGRGRAGHPRTVLYAAAVLLPQAAAAPGLLGSRSLGKWLMLSGSPHFASQLATVPLAQFADGHDTPNYTGLLLGL